MACSNSILQFDSSYSISDLPWQDLWLCFCSGSNRSSTTTPNFSSSYPGFLVYCPAFSIRINRSGALPKVSRKLNTVPYQVLLLLVSCFR